ncbi:MAG: ATP-binding protein [Elusimicrobiota bacterium]
MRLSPRKTAPGALAAAAARAMEYPARMEGRALSLSAPGGLPRVSADAPLIRRVIENLISNALRYAPKDSAVKVSAAARKGRVEFSVADRGPGVAPEHLGRVFDKYFQSDPAPGGGRKGKGLGLAFCRLAVEAHGGRIRAENLRPRGFAVRFDLPAAGKDPRPGGPRRRG